MDYLPIFARLDQRPCLVVGGGAVARRKVDLLLAARADVTVNAPALEPELARLAAAGRIRHAEGAFDPALVRRRFLVIAATDDVEINTRVYQAANAAATLVNVVDDPDRCSFITPAIVDRSPLIIAISSGGQAPVLARMLREWLEGRLPAALGRLTALAGSLRHRVKSRLTTVARRRRFWERAFSGEFARHTVSGDVGRARERFELDLEAAAGEGLPGEVYLVGAGPGDPGLLTLRALQLMHQADVILHDRLVSRRILDLARRDADRVAVGKAPGRTGAVQSDIEALMIRLAREGKRVLRLKGGDPFVFGRGGEEARALAAAGVRYEIVPGITAAAGSAAYAGIPLTDRDAARSVTLVTAHAGSAIEEADWAALARPRQTVVFYMGVGRAAEIGRRLIRHGRSPVTPVAIIENATTRAQRSICGQLEALPELVGSHGVRPPATIIVGETAGLAPALDWFHPTEEPADRGKVFGEPALAFG
jgi:uroporphyrin-III C-methyltransferase/precorrin-2 dehydrogenase/sirohydrochlorin ferrochelatase